MNDRANPMSLSRRCGTIAVTFRSSLLAVALVFRTQPVTASDPLFCNDRVAGYTYLVPFDSESADLTSSSRGAIGEAAQAVMQVQVTRLLVKFETYDIRSPRYGHSLTIERLKAITAELVRGGVPRSAISVAGVGFMHPIPPRDPCATEPPNSRRLEIVLHW